MPYRDTAALTTLTIQTKMNSQQMVSNFDSFFSERDINNQLPQKQISNLAVPKKRHTETQTLYTHAEI
jgi:hypothetical protein